MRKLLLLLGVALCIAACSRPLYFQYEDITDNAWNADSIKHFTFHIDDSSAAYNIILHIRHSFHYPYQNMWLFIDDSSLPAVHDTIEFYLADQRGRWLGNGITDTYDMPVLYHQNYQFPDTGYFSLHIEQAMRDSILCGVKSVGIEIEKVPVQP